MRVRVCVYMCAPARALACLIACVCMYMCVRAYKCACVLCSYVFCNCYTLSCRIATHITFLILPKRITGMSGILPCPIYFVNSLIQCRVVRGNGNGAAGIRYKELELCWEFPLPQLWFFFSFSAQVRERSLADNVRK